MTTQEEMLAKALRLGRYKGDAEAMAGELLQKYGSLAAILEMHVDDIRRIPGMSEQTALLLHLIPEISRYARRDTFGEHPLLNTYSRASAYMCALFRGKYYEQIYILALDARGRLIRCEMVQQGALTESPFHPQLLLDAAVRAEAHAVVLGHNHPGGTLAPSPGDVRSVNDCLPLFDCLGIILLDHIIVGDSQPVSIRQSRTYFEEEFFRQAPNDPLLTGWYD